MPSNMDKSINQASSCQTPTRAITVNNSSLISSSTSEVGKTSIGFRKFPPEIRNLIWEATMEPQIIEISYSQLCETPAIKFPVILHVNSESRAVGQKHYDMVDPARRSPSPIFINWKTDTVSFHCFDCLNRCFKSATHHLYTPTQQANHKRFLSKLRRITVARHLRPRFQKVFDSMPNLELVHCPNADGCQCFWCKLNIDYYDKTFLSRSRDSKIEQAVKVRDNLMNAAADLLSDTREKRREKNPGLPRLVIQIMTRPEFELEYAADELDCRRAGY